MVETVSKGIKVVTSSRKFLRSGAVMLLIGRGSYEDPIEGCACLTNNMHLRVTKRFSPLQLQTITDALGATIDTRTERDFMMLQAQAPSKKVKKCIEFLSEIVTHLCFPELHVAKEKTTQTIEYERIRQDPVTAAIEDCWEATYCKTPLAHPVTGYPSTIEKIDVQTLERFDTEAKEKAMIVVGIVGPQSEKSLTDFVRSCFDARPSVPQIMKHETSFNRSLNVLSKPLKAKQTTFSIGMKTPGVLSPEYPALLLIEDYLGSTRHYLGVLHRELREKRGLTYFAYSRLSTLGDCGLLSAFAGVRHEKTREALRLMLKSLVELRGKPIPERELQQLKTFHTQSVEAMLENPHFAATWLASNVFHGGQVDFESYVQDIGKVSPEIISKAAEKLLIPSHVALSIAGRPPSDEILRKTMREEIE